MRKGFSFRDLDWLLLFAAAALAGLGVAQIYSTTAHSALAGESRKQLDWVLLGLVAALVISQIDYHRVVEHAPALYLSGLVALGAVLVLGNTVAKTHRWLSIGGQTLQVSELVKLAIIVAVAFYLGRRAAKPVEWKDLAVLGVVAGAPGALVALEPDLGTALTYLAIATAGVVLTGLRGRQVLALGLLAAVLLPVGWHLMLPYQRDRVMSFTHPSEDSRRSGYQVTQSKIAVGSGGLWGKGLGHGTQSQLGFVPVSHADFIFASFAEEQGFVGTALVLSLYLVLLLRLLDGAQWAPDRAGAFLVAGLAAVLFFQVAVNVGMMIGWLPITGIPLPLMSQGGSSVFATFVGLGLALSVKRRRFVN
ncbi:MAG TPA: rod shape-determining protein RodA [Terriglobia bacterium]|jgi:rod shape determining protein RodA|nr:rod shape-determining protein RodA [Terriglobia bacterium]